MVEHKPVKNVKVCRLMLCRDISWSKGRQGFATGENAVALAGLYGSRSITSYRNTGPGAE